MKTLLPFPNHISLSYYKVKASPLINRTEDLLVTGDEIACSSFLHLKKFYSYIET